MNLQQLEYIVAVDRLRHFGQAAASCHVTQPTLSMMIRRLEAELETQIFDRSRQPIMPTPLGEAVIAQARVVLQAKRELLDLVEQAKGKTRGSLHLAIIPTLAPYLIPLLVQPFRQQYPEVRLHLSEMRTEEIVERLKQGEIDAGILVTPLEAGGIHEQILFYEELYVYSSHPQDKAYLVPEDINPAELWLLEEGHCFRSQIMNLCALQRQAKTHFAYEAGSIETLKRLVEQQQGVTILPELSVHELDADARQRIRPFAPPAPVREVSLVMHRPGLKARLTQALTQVVKQVIPLQMQTRVDAQIVSIQD